MAAAPVVARLLASSVRVVRARADLPTHLWAGSGRGRMNERRKQIRERGIKSVADLEERRHELLEENYRLREALTEVVAAAKAGRIRSTTSAGDIALAAAGSALGPETKS